ncbi:MAG: type B diterpene cyclase [Anaerolineae bacterium]
MNPIQQLLQNILTQPNAISVSAYDTAWLAWLMPEARDWLLDAQRPDGSWGADLEYYHDRVICTLSAINSLAATSTNGHDLKRIQRGIQYLEKAAPRLPRDPTETVGFELLAPSLLKTGQKLGLKLDEVARALEPYQLVYRQKIALIPPAMLYSPQATIAHSLEFIGLDDLDRAAIAGLRQANGSIHSSPAATAFCEIAGAGCDAGRDYLSALMEHYQGAVPTLAPFELFEIIWSLLHLYLGEDLTRFGDACRPLIERVEAGWGPEGIGLAHGFPADFDNTAAAFTLLSTFSRAPDAAVLEAFEEDDHFRCYWFERNISLDVHIHLIMALRQAPDFPRRDEMLLKAINVLSRYLQSDFITDKWHASPYYSTAHAIIALSGLADHLIEDQLYWLCHTQQEDGRWTFYPDFPPAAVEETAHALLGLLVAQKHNGAIARDIIERGMEYLDTHYQDHQALPALWVGKSLYHPLHITRSVFLAVFALYDQLH